MQVNVKADYSAVGDGVTDDTAAFQAAEDFIAAQTGGGTVYAPASTYIVKKLIHRSLVTLTGDGDTTILKNNVPAGSGSGDDYFVIHIGNFAPSTFAECLHYDLNDIAAGSTTVTLKTKADTSNFAVGEAVLIDTTNGFYDADLKFKPYQAFVNMITAINTQAGTITLKDAIQVAVPHAKIGSTVHFAQGTNNSDSYICKYPVIKNIRFESEGDWTLRWGTYKGVFDRISLKTTDIIGGNAIAYCAFTNIVADFSQKVIEMATYSHNSTVNGLTASWYDGAVDPTQKPIIKMGENVRSCVYSNLNIDSGEGLYFGYAIRFEHAFDNQINDSHFNCAAVSKNGVELTTGDSAAFVTGNYVKNNTFVLGNVNYDININSGSKNTLTKNTITGNTFIGAVKKNKINNNTSTPSNNIRNNTFITNAT